VHTRLDFEMAPPYVLRGDSQWVTTLEDPLIDARPLLPDGERIGHVLTAVSERMTTPTRLGAALGSTPRLPGEGGSSI
jgi:hypothetical protein